MALDGYIPSIFQRTFCHVPLYTVGVSSAFFLLAFLNVSEGSTIVFKYLVSVATVLGLINWINILVSHLYFCRALKVQSISRDVLPFSGYFMPQRTVITLFFTCVIVFFNGKHKRDFPWWPGTYTNRCSLIRFCLVHPEVYLSNLHHVLYWCCGVCTTYYCMEVWERISYR